ncbi:acyltransferase family protein [Clostridium felsineum]|uniref:acyltransferase family protein n=1 Tax=Clostridium felsineum TaxID=36839 RepID=UPI00098C9B45|nr:acyltransferase [Clostridium felsineum]URZ03845.1 hypothetical protein CLAUR_039110 [Clostridium felsineum]
MRKERLLYLDFIRAISIVIIVIFHFDCAVNQEKLLGNKTLFVNYTNGELGQIGVALFFIISGASLMYIYEQDFSLINYFKKRFIKIYPMFYIAYGCAFLYLFYINKSIQHSIPKKTFILTILGVDGYLSSTIPNYYILGEWFLGCIVLIYLCFPILRKIMIKYPKILFICTLIGYIVLVKEYNFNIRIDWNFITRIPDFLIGMYFIKYIKKVNIYQFLIALIITMVMFLVPLNINIMYKVTTMGMSSFFVLVYVAQFLTNKNIKVILEKISKYSYAIFLVHHITLQVIVSHFKGKVLSISEVLCIFIITCIIIMILSICLYNINSKVLKYIKNIKSKEDLILQG